MRDTAVKKTAKWLSMALLGMGASVSFAMNYQNTADGKALIDQMVEEHGFDRQELTTLLSKAERQDSILEAIARPAEKAKPWHEYRKIFVTDKRRDAGVAFYKEHETTLKRAEHTYGVPAEIIVAIIGVETYYGRIAGRYKVLNALSTLAFDYPKRSPFFTKELKHYLLLTREQKQDPTVLQGSYAGAMGYGQFMPSSYRNYAVDFDEDGTADIWNNPVDAIGSVANYFKRHGWKEGGEVIAPAVLGKNVPASLFNDGLKPKHTLAEYAEQDLTTPVRLPGNTLATAIRFDQQEGYSYWLGLPNFYVITRYNHSAMYAMCVYQLSQSIARELTQ